MKCGNRIDGGRIAGMTLLAMLCCAWTAGQTQEVSSTPASMQAARKEAAWKQRRIMYNDDGNHTAPFSTPEEFIALRLRQLEHTQVDTISYCTGGGGLFWGHQAQVGEVLGEFVGDHEGQQVKDICSSLEALKAIGEDPLSLAIQFGHARSMEVFWSYRMNNIEDSFAACYHPRWKRDHPEYLLGNAEDYAQYPMTDPRKWWAALNFAEEEVRNYTLRIFEDVFTRYDIDGIDMDWFRHPRFFPETTEERPVTPEHIALMNDFMRKVRALADRIGAARGRPLLIASRLPLSVERCLAIGLDLPTWLEEDLVDIVTFGGDLGPLAMAPQLRAMVALAHRHQTPALANIGGSGLQPNTGYYTEEAWWAAATNAWYAGVDGIYTFNLFPEEKKEQYAHIGSPETLKGLDKLYAIDPVLPKDFWGFNRSALVVPDRLPLNLYADRAISATLPIGEDLANNARPGQRPQLRLRLRLSAQEGESLQVSVNGKKVGSAMAATSLSEKATPTWFELEVSPSDFCLGMNHLLIRILSKRPGNEAIPLDRLELVVHYHKD